MPRYFFNTAEAFCEPDQIGRELEDLNAARKAAVQFLGDLFSRDPHIAWDGRDFRVDVTDADQQPVLIMIAMGINAAAVLPTKAAEEALPQSRQRH